MNKPNPTVGLHQGANGLSDSFSEGCVMVITDPGLEQIAEDVESLSLPPLLPEELEKAADNRRAGRVKVQVGYEKRRHRAKAPARAGACSTQSWIVTFSMTTSSTGTS